MRFSAVSNFQLFRKQMLSVRRSKVLYAFFPFDKPSLRHPLKKPFETSSNGDKLCRNVQHNDTQYNDTQHNDIQYNNTQHNDTQLNDTQHNDTQHTNTQHNDTQHNETQHNDTQHSTIMLNVMFYLFLCSMSYCKSVSK